MSCFLRSFLLLAALLTVAVTAGSALHSFHEKKLLGQEGIDGGTGSDTGTLGDMSVGNFDILVRAEKAK
ncbi:hypothetical protein COU77_00990 [Candidatus Peregrinibacteria bacterium CG10_big_fil_rev_8_21_14_0_10_49_16]|nr:MAG: hypothetical protein COW95_03380 [Candidatus Peregrinibacteria bacterium CG22_combo_CG10-13_8_21_14_all_49_11]PIR52309.1 MAG: hypothetical protein COU77_00990 [Candidatus Peregrinibacteria bacterium CG10_big_fil_rev_8_21_14_0_10_49_16]